jgi:DNA-binding Lrp family transcriptional regulator
MSELDALDHLIIRHLSLEGRLSMNELARRCNISRATAYSRIARLETLEVITGYGARVDHAKVGRAITALVFCKVNTTWTELQDKLLALPGVEHMWFVSGTIDFVLVVRVNSIEEFRDGVLGPLHTMPEIVGTETNFALAEMSGQLGESHDSTNSATS